MHYQYSGLPPLTQWGFEPTFDITCIILFYKLFNRLNQAHPPHKQTSAHWIIKNDILEWYFFIR